MISVIALIVIAFIVFNYIKKCTHEVVDVVDNVNNVVQNPVSTIIDHILHPNSFAGSSGAGGEPTNPTDVPVKKKFRTDPHIDAGIYSSFIPPSKDYALPKVGVGLSLFSYGVSKKDNKFRFVRIGVGGWPNTGVDLTVAPIMYNLGDCLPLITNTYIYPHIGYNINNNKVIAGAGLSLSF